MNWLRRHFIKNKKVQQIILISHLLYAIMQMYILFLIRPKLLICQSSKTSNKATKSLTHQKKTMMTSKTSTRMKKTISKKNLNPNHCHKFSLRANTNVLTTKETVLLSFMIGHVEAPCCKIFYPCKLCHDEKYQYKKGCQMERMEFEKVQNVKCLEC
jgi:hypothetical protein